MKRNVGSTDRWIRVIVGLGILASGFTFRSWWGLVGLLPLSTALFARCGLYSLLKIDTGAHDGSSPAQAS